MSTGRNLHFTLDPIYTYPTLKDRGQDLLHQIAGIYEAGNPPEQSELLMDGTFAMMLRSHDGACATELSAPLPLPVPSPAPETTSDSVTSPISPPQILSESPASPTFKKCRKCAGKYVFSLPSGGGDVTILGGAPDFDVAQRRPYKTMSYVWGTLPPSPISIPCLACGQTTSIPMLSVQRFHNLMALAGGGNTIWLDALSINQSDPVDVAANLAIMGKIYKNGQCVSVLLPASDKPAYECLDAIERDAKIILMHRANFIQNSDFKFQDPESGENVNVLSTVCQMFLENLQSLAGHLHRFAYWSRAWTFQEWALAPDLEVAVEGWEKPETCFNLKSLVLGAAMLISRYKILQHQYAEIKLGRDLSRGMVPPLFNVVKSLFPDEDLFLSYEETDAKKVSFQTNFPHVGVTDLLGVRSVPPPSSASPPDSIDDIPTPRSVALTSRPTPLSQIRARVILLLAAFASSQRSAKYEADLVACWASMCNIPYVYNRDDDFTTAKRKAMNALRSQGMVIYDFLPDGTLHHGTGNDEGTRTPVNIFRMYAKEHPQLNATNNAEFPGAPIFTGRADTVCHLMFALDQISLPTEWMADSNASSLDETTFLPVLDAKVTNTLSLDGDSDHLSRELGIWKDTAIYGYIPGLAGFQFWDLHEAAKVYLEKIPAERRKVGRLVIVRVPFHKGGESLSTSATTSTSTETCDLHLWGIIPADISSENLEIYREPINGSLVLVVNDGPGQKHLIAYLLLSDHLSGSYLICTNLEGKVELEVRIPERGDMSNTVYRQFAVRRLDGHVRFGVS